MIYYECSGVFKAINSTVDGILSLGELLDMAGRLELFLTEEEGSRIFSLMDIDGDEKVRIMMKDYLILSFILRIITLLLSKPSPRFRSHVIPTLDLFLFYIIFLSLCRHLFLTLLHRSLNSFLHENFLISHLTCTS